MDLAQLREERERLAEEFRSVMTSLSLLRAQHLGCTDDDVRRQLFAVIEEQSDKVRELGARLVDHDAAIFKREAAKPSSSPLASAPLDF